jgi:hypothetical protein
MFMAVLTQTDRLNTALAGRYRIERHLGEGGMATVYLAEDLKHDRKVALKLLKPELAAVLGAERFVQEIKTTAALQHPHILPLFDSGTADGFLFYVMPYIEGETLRDKLTRETQLGVDEAVRIARDVADALDYAHRHGVIHRDIKPENILLHDGRPMVADFGIALAVSAAAGGRMTETGLSLGTPHYMSPEQATAQKEITARSDVYSLGSVLYEMLTGQPPHTGASAQQIVMKIIAEPAESVTKYRKSVPPNVAAAVAKSIEKVPADRFESAKAFADALGNPSYTSAAHMEAAAIGRGAARVFTAPFIAASVVAAVAIVIGVWGWRRPEPPHEVSRFSLLLPDSQSLGAGNFIRLAVSPDGRKIVYVGRGATSATTRLWVRALDQLRATPIAGTENGGNPAFSPDGKRIAFATTTPRAIRTVAVAGGPVLTLVDSLVDLGGVSWADDGYIYYDGHLTGDGLARVRETGGKPEVASMPDTAARETFHNMPSALPGKRGVIFTAAHGGGASTSEVAVLDARTGKHKVLAHGLAGRYVASGHLVYVTDGGTLMAAPFDLDRLAITGEAVPITDGLAVRATQRVDLAISPTGLMTYVQGFSRGNDRELVWVSRDGQVTQVDPQWTGLMSGRLALSPDGKRVAIGLGLRAAESQLWVKQLDRGPASKIADNGINPMWSADGRTLMFVSTKGGQGVMKVPADGSTFPAQFRAGGQRAIVYADWSRDGKWIAFASDANIYGFSADGDTTRRELVSTPAVEGQPEISPDGRWLAYVSDETGRPEVYVRPFPDTKIAKHQVSVGGGSRPRWSRDGREVFFVDDKFDLIAVPITPGAVFTAGTPRVLFGAEPFVNGPRTFDVSADGKRFLMIRPAGATVERADELIVVENFFEELKAKVPIKK